MIGKLLSSLSKDSFNNSNVIINWNPLKRCILVLFLASGLNVLWLLWKTFIIFTPQLHTWVDLPLVHSLVNINIFFICILFLLIYPCYRLQHHTKAEALLPYFCVTIFVLTLIFDGYMVGLVSPATICSMVSVITVGFVLFNAKLVYTILLPSVLLIFALMYASIIGEIPYAPIFNLEIMHYQPYFNRFWLVSMLIFILPIAIVSFTIFNIMLAQWRAREQVYQTLSQIDPLTRLLNRRSINEYFKALELNNTSQTKTCCIILMDIDYFKKINDRYGHLKGDEVLSQVAEVLKLHTRPEDLVGRYGGEEFIIIINNDDKILVSQIAERCRRAIMSLELYANGQRFPVTASFGVSFWHEEQSTIQDALHQADVAMYQAKDAGRNIIVFST